jgi:PAS domain S-box-containing protein
MLTQATKGTGMDTKSADVLEAVIDSLPGTVFRCSSDKEFTFEYVSTGITELLGYQPANLVHINAFRKLVHPEDQRQNKEILKRITKENPRYEMLYRMRTVDGEDKWVKEQGLAIYSDAGEMTHINGILTDVTAQKSAELELQNENRLLKAAQKDRFRLGKLIGKSPSMQRVYDVVLKAAANKGANVLITGESGTGKELAARAIHDLSERRDKAFVAVNCGAIPENLFESEFFGYLKGAFTGAAADKKGYLDAANGGTLFLDEVGEIPASLQVKLLRALENKSFIPVGANTPKRSDFRIVAATNHDLSQQVAKGEMRMDFFFRINVIPIRMPSLRDRGEDILLLVEHFLERFETETEKVILPFELLTKMRRHTWPGNVRELKNAVERYMTMGELSFLKVLGSIPNAGLLPVPNPTEGPGTTMTLPEALDTCERNLILQALNECRWKKGVCARRLGISWRTLQRKLKKHAIE